MIADSKSDAPQHSYEDSFSYRSQRPPPTRPYVAVINEKHAMTGTETGEQAASFFGDKLYQQRARAALPILVRQAQAGQTIFYSDLAREMAMANPRNLNYVLGSVGQTLIQLSKELGEEIPPIQCLVINQADGLPGEGVGLFIEKAAFRQMSKRQRRIVVDAQLQKIYAYDRWAQVLSALSLKPATQDFSSLVRKAATGGRGGGESLEHLRLKQFVATHPEVIGLRASLAHGVNEYGLPSGDEVDVLFRNGSEWIAVEVKSRISDDGDLARGIFQCVKYKAVLEAFLLTTARTPNVRAVLVTERSLTNDLVALKNMLGVEVIVSSVPVADRLPANGSPSIQQ